MSANFDFSSFVAPSKAVAELALANFEKMTGKNTQMFGKYAEMGISDIKEAMEISDFDGFNSYMSKRNEVTKAWADSVSSDAQELAKISEEYTKEVSKVFTEEFEKVAKKDV